jgi:hypothetical protein
MHSPDDLPANADTPDLGVLWGAAAIGGFINLRLPNGKVDIRKTYHLLETSAIDANKVRGTWISTRARLTRQFATPRAELTQTVAEPDIAPPAIRQRPLSRGAPAGTADISATAQAPLTARSGRPAPLARRGTDPGTEAAPPVIERRRLQSAARRGR